MTSIEALTDEELLTGLIEGRQDAFTMLYNRHQSKIYRLIHRYVHSSALAQDLLQEVFIKVWNNRKQLHNVRSFNAYLLVTARNHTLNSLKSALLDQKTMGEIVNNFIALRTEGDEQVLERDYAAFLQRELDRLPLRTREIFRMCRQQGYTYEEVAAQLGISRNAVKNHMVFSMKVLKSAVEKEIGISLAMLLAVVFLK